MIQEIKAYQCLCDNCGRVIEFGEGGNYFKEREWLQDWIENDEDSLRIIDGKHICDDCIELDEETDEYVIKKLGQ